MQESVFNGNLEWLCKVSKFYCLGKIKYTFFKKLLIILYYATQKIQPDME
jgi:hypothetical protein